MMYRSLCTEFYDIDKQFAPKEEIAFFKRFLNKEDLILEPMCGSGRLLIPLLEEGYQIYGLDNSSDMLNSCRARAKAKGLEPLISEASIESFTLPQLYQTIIIPNGSFQLLYPRETAIKALLNLHRHLKVGGKLILDLFTPEEALPGHKQEELTEKEVKTPTGERIQHISHNQINKNEQVMFCDSIYIKSKKGIVIQKEKEQMYIAWYSRHEIDLLLEKCGFSQISYLDEHFRDINQLIYIAGK